MPVNVAGGHADALWSVHDLAQGAKGNQALCAELDAYLQDIVRVFDAEGGRPSKPCLRDGAVRPVHSLCLW